MDITHRRINLVLPHNKKPFCIVQICFLVSAAVSVSLCFHLSPLSISALYPLLFSIWAQFKYPPACLHLRYPLCIHYLVSRLRSSIHQFPLVFALVSTCLHISLHLAPHQSPLVSAPVSACLHSSFRFFAPVSSLVPPRFPLGSTLVSTWFHPSFHHLVFKLSLRSLGSSHA